MEIQKADLNKDGNQDLVVANWFKPPTIYYNNSNGGFNDLRPLPSLAVEEGVYIGHSVGINDFNNDSKPDILYARNGSNNTAYLSQKVGNLQDNTIDTNN